MSELNEMISVAYLENKTRVIDEIKRYLKGEYYSPRNVNFVRFPTREYVINVDFSLIRSQVFSLLILLMYIILFIFIYLM